MTTPDPVGQGRGAHRCSDPYLYLPWAQLTTGPGTTQGPTVDRVALEPEHNIRHRNREFTRNRRLKKRPFQWRPSMSTSSTATTRAMGPER